MKSKNNCICITVCINYSDYLRNVISKNLKLFKRILIVTTLNDIETINLVNSLEFSNCKLFFTNLVNQNNSVFNKSAMIRQAQKYVYEKYPNDWICLLDADIKVPREFKNIDLNKLNKNALYGIVRHVHVNSYDTEFKIQKFEDILGYFQLYYKKKYYDKNSYNASVCDITFNKYFKHKEYLDPLTCVHIGPTEINWNGRKSKVYV